MRNLLLGRKFAFYLPFCIILFLSSCTALQLQPVEQNRSMESGPQSSLDKQNPAVKPITNTSSQIHPLTLQEPHTPEPKKIDPVDDIYSERPRQTSNTQNRVEAKKPAVHRVTPISTDKAQDNFFTTDSGSEPLVINMEDAELYDVVLFFIKQLDLNCIIEPNITGKITIRTAGKLNTNDLFPLFFQILEANGLTAVKEGKFYRIITMVNASRTTIPFSNDVNRGLKSPGMLMQIIPLQYINSEEMVKILTPFISEQGSLISHANSKNLLLVDTSRNVEKILKLVRTFDVDMFASIGHRFFPIQYIDSTRAGQTLTEVLPLYGDENSKIKIINLEKINSLLVLSDNESVFGKIDELLSELDQPVNDVESHIYLYFLKNSQAEEMADLLNSIFVPSLAGEIKNDKNGAEEEKKGTTLNPFAAEIKASQASQASQASKETQAKPVQLARQTSVSDFGTGALRGEIKITQDNIRNALIIDAIPSDYRIVERVLERLDVLPRQVLISVTIVDVQLDDDLNLGVEWQYSHQSDANIISDTFYNIATGSSGLGFAIGETNKWDATLSALAQKKKVNIVASPSVLASNNIVANIDISTEIPVASAQITYDDTNTNKTQTDIQYRNTGIILNVTPHINEYGLVSMDLSQEVSEQSAAVTVGNSTYPSFFKRSVKTTLTVNSGQTIAIGGLIREQKSENTKGVPVLSELPFIGWLFGSYGTGISKSELIILITPTVIATPDDIDVVTEEFKTKMNYNQNQ